MPESFQQIRLESIAEAPDHRVADHLRPVGVSAVPSPWGDELLVRVVLSPIHPCDILCAAGLVPKRAGARDGSDSTEFLPGIEAVGVVEAVGSGLEDEFEPGQRVFVCCWAPWGRWEEANGVWSEYLLVKKENVIAVPDGISDSSAAMFMVVPVTAYVMMIEMLDLRAGDWLLQNASGSAVGRWVIALAEELGINTINLVRREEQVEELKQETGAEHVLWCPSDGSANPQLQQEILRITGNGRVKGAFDAVADGLSATLMLNVMSRYGTLIVYGVLANSGVALGFDASVRMVLEGMKITGFSLQNWWLPDTPDEVKQRVYRAVWNHIRNNPALNPQVESIYAFKDVDQAIRSSLEPKTGKVLLCPRPADATHE